MYSYNLETCWYSWHFVAFSQELGYDVLGQLLTDSLTLGEQLIEIVRWSILINWFLLMLVLNRDSWWGRQARSFCRHCAWSWYFLHWGKTRDYCHFICWRRHGGSAIFQKSNYCLHCHRSSSWAGCTCLIDWLK